MNQVPSILYELFQRTEKERVLNNLLGEASIGLTRKLDWEDMYVQLNPKDLISRLYKEILQINSTHKKNLSFKMCRIDE